jgi:hypothetical protein
MTRLLVPILLLPGACDQVPAERQQFADTFPAALCAMYETCENTSYIPNDCVAFYARQEELALEVHACWDSRRMSQCLSDLSRPCNPGLVPPDRPSACYMTSWMATEDGACQYEEDFE